MSWSFVQFQSNANDSTSTPISIEPSGFTPTLAGDVLVVAIMVGDQTQFVTGVSDNQTSPGWSRLAQFVGTGAEIELWANLNIKAGVTIVTISTNNTTVDFIDVMLCEYTPPAGYLLAFESSTNGAETGGSPVTTGTMTATIGNDLIVVAFIANGVHSPLSNGFTLRSPALGVDGCGQGDLLNQTVGSYSCAATVDAGGGAGLIAGIGARGAQGIGAVGNADYQWLGSDE